MYSNQRKIIYACLVSTIALSVQQSSLYAAAISKANNTITLNISSSWIGSIVPGSSDVALFDNTLTSSISTSLGAATSWQGIQIIDAAGSITINADGNTLLLGSGGVNMSSSDQSLFLHNSVQLSADQTWIVHNSRTLLLDAPLNIGAFALNFTGNGVLLITSSIAGTGSLTNGGGTILSSTASTYTGSTSIFYNTMHISSIADGGLPSSIGESSNAVANLAFSNPASTFGGASPPTLEYDGATAGITNRLFSVSALAKISSARSALNFTNPNALAFPSGSGTVSLSSASLASNSFAPQIIGANSSLSVGGLWSITNPGNSYGGPTNIGGIVTVDKLANGGLPSDIGASSNLATSLVFSSGTLRYIGTGDSTDRLLSGTSPTIDASGTGPLVFSNASILTLTPGVTLSGSSTALNVFDPSISGTLNKTGTGTWSVRHGAATSVAGGLLILDYTDVSVGGVGGAGPTVGGGELRILGSSFGGLSLSWTQTVFSPGSSRYSVIKDQGPAPVIALGTLFFNTGASVDFGLPSSGSLTTSSVNAAGSILSGVATTSLGTTWATVSSGQILPLATYVNDIWLAGNDTDVTASNPLTSATTNSLRFNTPSSTALSLSGVNTISSGGILITPAVALNPTAIVGGTLLPGAGNNLIIHQNNTAGIFTLASNITNNGATAVTLTTAGAGSILLTGANTFTGTFYLLNANVQVGSANALPASGSLYLTGTLDLNGFSASFGQITASALNSVAVITNTSAIPSTVTLASPGAGLLFIGTFSSVAANPLNLQVTGSWTFSNRQHYSGNTILAGGSLGLTADSRSSNDFGADTLPVTSTLRLRGGSLTLMNFIEQHFNSASAESGQTTISTLGAFPTAPALHIEALSRAPGATIFFATQAAPDGAVGSFINSLNGTPLANGPSGILAGWAVTGTATSPLEFAVAYPSLNNSIGGGATYTSAFDIPTTNTSLTSSIVANTNATTGSLRFTGGGAVLTLSGANVIASGGVLVTAATSGTNQISGGAGTSLSSGSGELFIQQWNNTFTIGAPIVDNGTPLSLVKSGPGTLSLTATNTYSGTTFINAGRLRIAAANPNLHAITGSGILFVDTGATATADAVTTASLVLNGTLAIRFNGNSTSKVSNLTLAGASNAWTAQLDLSNNALIVESASNKSTTLSTLANQIKTGSNNGFWNGKGITSSTAALDPTDMAVGLFDNATLGKTSFGGTSVTPNSILVTSALIGDANLDGRVNAADLDIIAANWGLTNATNWAAGDLNGDGNVDSLDVNLIVDHWDSGASLVPRVDYTSGFSYTLVAVPEPASLVMAALSIPLLLRRRSNSR